MELIVLIVAVVAFGGGTLFLINRLVDEAQEAARLALRAATIADASAARLLAAVDRIEVDLAGGHARADAAHDAKNGSSDPGELADAAARTDTDL
jgi:hypothetical protein